MSSPRSIDARALAAVAAALGVAAQELTLHALARGVTHETLLVRRGELPLGVLRLAPPRAGMLPRHDPASEGRLLRLVAGGPVPVPEVLLLDERGALLGRPGLLMRYCPGHSTLTWEQLRERGGEATAAHALATLVALHAMPLPAGWPDRDDAAGHAQRDLAGVRRLLRDDDDGAAQTSLAAALAALAADPPPRSGAPAIVHGDYRPANMMVADGRVAAVLDWEMATSGDRACDLGIATMREWGCWWPDEELLDRYGALAGTAIAVRSLRWWRCLGYAKVLAFLARRAAERWGGGPALAPWEAGLARALREWRES